jgi:surfeit locus 1 family protein
MTIFMARDCSSAPTGATAQEPGARRRSGRIAVVAALLMIALTARLGVWQLDRAAQKQALQVQQAQRERLPVLDASSLARSPEQSAAQLQRTVRLQGRWASEATVFLDNRPMAGQVGFHVLTPLRLDDGSAVLVQRGWAPRHRLQRDLLPPVHTPQGRVSLQARVIAEPSRLRELGAPVPAGPIRQNLDLATAARETGLALRPLVLLQLDAPGQPPGADGLRRDWPAPDFGIERHHGYAVQWFALSALGTGLLLWFGLLRSLLLPPCHRSDASP